MTNFEQWQVQGKALAEQHTTAKWVLADWLAAGDTAFGGGAYDEAQRLFPDLSRKYLTQIAYTARNVTSTVRQYKLSFTHHELVAGLEPAEQDRYLTQAVKDGWTCPELRRQLKDVDRVQEFSLPVSADLFRQLNEFAALVNVAPEALLTTAVVQFLQAPPADLKAQYEAAVVARREQCRQEQQRRDERLVVAQELAKVAEARAQWVKDSSRAVMQIDIELHTPTYKEALEVLKQMVAQHEPEFPVTVLQEQLEKVLALAKPPEPVPTQEEQVTATV